MVLVLVLVLVVIVVVVAVVVLVMVVIMAISGRMLHEIPSGSHTRTHATVHRMAYWDSIRVEGSHLVSRIIVMVTVVVLLVCICLVHL